MKTGKSMVSGLLAVMLAVASGLAGAQGAAGTWPTKPLRVIVPFPPGGIVDTVARQVQLRLQQALGQPVLVDNRSGAGGTIGVGEAARSTDGHTVVMVFDSYATYPLVYPKLPFDIKRDLVPVTQMARNPLILVVNPRVPANDLKSFVALLKAQPDRLNYASVGAGSSNHLTAELFKSVTNTAIAHVPYRGGGPAQQDLLGGQIEMMFLSAVLAQPHVKAGKLRAIAQTGSRRVAAYAETPTVQEGGYPQFEVNSWVGMLAPATMPREALTRLENELRKILTAPDFVAKLDEQGLEPIGNTPEQFRAQLDAEQEKWTKLVRERNLSME